MSGEPRPVSVLWITSGLGCDGDSIAMTAATNPSLEDLLRGCLPGMPPLVLYNPVFAFETGDDFMRAFDDAARARSTRSSSCSRARSRTRRSTATGTGRRSASIR